MYDSRWKEFVFLVKLIARSLGPYSVDRKASFPIKDKSANDDDAVIYPMLT